MFDLNNPLHITYTDESTTSGVQTAQTVLCASLPTAVDSRQLGKGGSYLRVLERPPVSHPSGDRIIASATEKQSRHFKNQSVNDD